MTLDLRSMAWGGACAWPGSNIYRSFEDPDPLPGIVVAMTMTLLWLVLVETIAHYRVVRR